MYIRQLASTAPVLVCRSDYANGWGNWVKYIHLRFKATFIRTDTDSEPACIRISIDPMKFMYERLRMSRQCKCASTLGLTKLPAHQLDKRWDERKVRRLPPNLSRRMIMRGMIHVHNDTRALLVLTDLYIYKRGIINWSLFAIAYPPLLLSSSLTISIVPSPYQFSPRRIH